MLSIVLSLFGCLRLPPLSPGGAACATLRVRRGERSSLSLSAANLSAGAMYECRASWPGTAPAAAHFAAGRSARATAEKVLFRAAHSAQDIAIEFTGIGVAPRGADALYALPVCVSLDRLHCGLTAGVWALILCVAPVLAAGCAIAVKV